MSRTKGQSRGRFPGVKVFAIGVVKEHLELVRKECVDAGCGISDSAVIRYAVSKIAREIMAKEG